MESAASDPDNLGHIDVQGTTLRGWINEQLLHKYKIVARDEDGSVIPEFSLLHLLENCTDFKNETSQLEYLCEALGVRAVITTKYHAEYAGEGVEYSWGLSELHYQRYPLESKLADSRQVQISGEALYFA